MHAPGSEGLDRLKWPFRVISKKGFPGCCHPKRYQLPDTRRLPHLSKNLFSVSTVGRRSAQPTSVWTCFSFLLCVIWVVCRRRRRKIMRQVLMWSNIIRVKRQRKLRCVFLHCSGWQTLMKVYKLHETGARQVLYPLKRNKDRNVRKMDVDRPEVRELSVSARNLHDPRPDRISTVWESCFEQWVSSWQSKNILHT